MSYTERFKNILAGYGYTAFSMEEHRNADNRLDEMEIHLLKTDSKALDLSSGSRDWKALRDFGNWVECYIYPVRSPKHDTAEHTQIHLVRRDLFAQRRMVMEQYYTQLSQHYWVIQGEPEADEFTIRYKCLLDTFKNLHDRAQEIQFSKQSSMKSYDEIDTYHRILELIKEIEENRKKVPFLADIPFELI